MDDSFGLKDATVFVNPSFTGDFCEFPTKSNKESNEESNEESNDKADGKAPSRHVNYSSFSF
jgi:hypothetical protein